MTQERILKAFHEWKETQSQAIAQCETRMDLIDRSILDALLLNAWMAGGINVAE